MFVCAREKRVMRSLLLLLLALMVFFFDSFCATIPTIRAVYAAIISSRCFYFVHAVSFRSFLHCRLCLGCSFRLSLRTRSPFRFKCHADSANNSHMGPRTGEKHTVECCLFRAGTTWQIHKMKYKRRSNTLWQQQQQQLRQQQFNGHHLEYRWLAWKKKKKKKWSEKKN